MKLYVVGLFILMSGFFNLYASDLKHRIEFALTVNGEKNQIGSLTSDTITTAQYSGLYKMKLKPNFLLAGGFQSLSRSVGSNEASQASTLMGGLEFLFLDKENLEIGLGGLIGFTATSLEVGNNETNAIGFNLVPYLTARAFIKENIFISGGITYNYQKGQFDDSADTDYKKGVLAINAGFGIAL